MKRVLRIGGAILLGAFFFSLGARALSSDLPAADPGAIWAHITSVSPYETWPQWPDHSGVHPGRAPHGPLHAIYVNPPMLGSTRAPAKYGSMIVKASFSRAKKLSAITVMYKFEGSNPKAGDWYWVKYSPGGRAGPYGRPAGCVGCHSAKSNNDYIFVHDLK